MTHHDKRTRRDALKCLGFGSAGTLFALAGGVLTPIDLAAAIASGLAPEISRERHVTRPEVAGSSPASRLSSVVLPDPDGPSSETNSRGATLSVTLSSTRTAP